MENAWIESILKRNQRETEILKVLKFENDEVTVPKGDNYLSVIKRIKLEMILCSGRRIKKTFVVKVMLEGKKAEAFKQMEPFKIEVKIYENVFKQMESLMDEFEDNREKLWCQMYGYQPYSVIVFDDLKELGYEIAERRNCLDLSHAKLYLRSIARFHAMSRILIEREILSATDTHPFYVAKMWDVIASLFKGSAANLSKIVLKKWPAEWKEFGLKLEKLQHVILKRLQDLTIEEKNRESALIVLNHGDSWTTNMMFKYSEDRMPTSIKLLDFQVSHVSSYIWDVLYFLYTSVKPEVRRSNLKDLLKLYWESLDANLRRYGYEKYIPSLNDVFEEAERKDLFSFTVLTFFHPGMTGDVDEAFDMEKAADGADDVINEEVFLAPKFLKECGEDFKYFMHKGVL